MPLFATGAGLALGGASPTALRVKQVKTRRELSPDERARQRKRVAAAAAPMPSPPGLRRPAASPRAVGKRSKPSVRIVREDDDEDENDGESRAQTALRSSTWRRSDPAYAYAYSLDLVDRTGLRDAELGITHLASLGGGPDDVVVELAYPGSQTRERFRLFEKATADPFCPVTDLCEAVTTMDTYFCADPGEPAALAFEDTSESARRMAKLFRMGRNGELAAFCDAYNKRVDTAREQGQTQERVADWGVCPPAVASCVLGQVYTRAVAPRVDHLKKYEGKARGAIAIDTPAFSNNVYGELMPRFVSQILGECDLRPEQTFVDLGSGVGNCVLQAALEIHCESWGCEIMEEAAHLASMQESEFKARTQLWGLRHGETHLLHGDFLDTPEIGSVLRRANVVLVNNYAFHAELQGKLVDLFLELPDRCKVITLKPFLPTNLAITMRTLDAPANMFHVEQREYFSGSVSWTNMGGHYYIHTVDRGRVRRWMEAHAEAAGEVE